MMTRDRFSEEQIIAIRRRVDDFGLGSSPANQATCLRFG
jgi:hypothetical protein